MTTHRESNSCCGGDIIVGDARDWREIPAVECPGCRQRVGTHTDYTNLRINRHDARRFTTHSFTPHVDREAYV